jgi:FlaA1/EpsC-like NDP-sugar epimerase
MAVKMLRNRYVLLADVCLIPVVAFAAFAMRFDLHLYLTRPEFPPFVAAALIVKPAIFYAFGLYRRYWRYASVKDMNAVLLASTASLIVMGALVTLRGLSDPLFQFSRAVLVTDGILTFLVAGGVRMSVRVIDESRDRARDPKLVEPKRVLIIGAGNTGAMVAREMDRNRHLGVTPVGFLDDEKSKLGKQIYGARVLGTTSSLARVVREHDIEEVVIAMPSAPGSVVRAIADDCRNLGVTSRAMPGVFELLDGNVSVSRLRTVDISDLLRRAPVTPAETSSRYVAGRTVLVTGAGGSIGLELCRQVARARPSTLVLLGHGENSIFEAEAELRDRYPNLNLVSVIADIRDERRIRRMVEQFRPAIVFHAAAHKHVPLMEQNPEEAITNNVLGTHCLIDACVGAGVERFVLISSDKAVSPSSVMGASKRVAEMLVRDAARRTRRSYVVVRFGNVLGSRGSVVPFFKRQIERGGPVTLTHPDMTRYFMTIPEAVHLVLEAGGMGRGGELFVLNMGEPVKIVDLARDLIKLSGFSLDEIPIVFTGVRPGEKMSERLWEDDAVTESTSHPDVIRVLETHDPSAADIPGILRALGAAASAGDALQMQALLANCIPTFAPILDN